MLFRSVARSFVSLLAVFLFLFLNVFCSGESSLFIGKVLVDALRSEERRVGKECFWFTEMNWKLKVRNSKL